MRERYRVRWLERFWRCVGAVGVGLFLALAPSSAMASPDRHATFLDKLPPSDLSSAALAYINDRSNAVAFEELHSAALASEASIPAFARKYGLRCSACHTAWPELNAFGQKFKDNGYQLGNDRDSPIWMSPNYWPAAVRTTVGWNMERTTSQVTDASDSATVTQSGFDISGFDLLMLGTLAKNITFGFVPTYDNGEGVSIETAFVRFDNLMNSTWANLKVGKFELDNLLSEKRILTLSNNGGLYQSYHFVPVGSATVFGLGDNQIGAEIMGHNANSYTRYSVAVLDATDGEPGNSYGQRYDAMVTVSQAFDGGKLGVQRIGAYAYFGQQPTSYQTAGGEPIAGSGTDNKSFYRIGVVGDFFFKNWEFLPFYLRGQDNAYLANGLAGTDPLAPGMQDAQWNGYLGELHYYFNPQFLVLGRAEWIRMSQQGDVATPSTLGNIDAFTIGTRWYPIMTSRTGLAVLTELSTTKTIGAVPLSGDGTGEPPFTPATPVRSTSLLFGLDYDF